MVCIFLSFPVSVTIGETTLSTGTVAQAASVEDATYESWLDGWETGDTYSGLNSFENDSEEYRDPTVADWIASAIEAAVSVLARSTVGSFLLALADEMGAGLENVVYGRVGTGSTNYFQFGLEDGNIYGVCGSILYALLRNFIFSIFAIQFIWIMGSYLIKGTGRGRSDLKLALYNYVFMFVLLYAVPIVTDIIIALRDALLRLLVTLTSAVSGNYKLGITDAVILATEDDYTLVGAAMLCFVAGGGIYFAVTYVRTAVQQIYLFGTFPVVAYRSFTDKQILNKWAGQFITAIFTPLLDAVGLWLVALIQSIASKGKGPALLGLIVYLSIIPCRNTILQLFGMPVPGRGFSMTAAAMMLMRTMGRNGLEKSGTGMHESIANSTESPGGREPIASENVQPGQQPDYYQPEGTMAGGNSNEPSALSGDSVYQDAVSGEEISGAENYEDGMENETTFQDEEQILDRSVVGTTDDGYDVISADGMQEISAGNTLEADVSEWDSDMPVHGDSDSGAAGFSGGDYDPTMDSDMDIAPGNAGSAKNGAETYGGDYGFDNTQETVGASGRVNNADTRQADSIHGKGQESGSVEFDEFGNIYGTATESDVATMRDRINSFKEKTMGTPVLGDMVSAAGGFAKGVVGENGIYRKTAEGKWDAKGDLAAANRKLARLGNMVGGASVASVMAASGDSGQILAGYVAGSAVTSHVTAKAENIVNSGTGGAVDSVRRNIDRKYMPSPDEKRTDAGAPPRKKKEPRARIEDRTFVKGPNGPTIYQGGPVQESDGAKEKPKTDKQGKGKPKTDKQGNVSGNPPQKSTPKTPQEARESIRTAEEFLDNSTNGEAGD